jgi:hypothetical protein
MPLGDDFFTCAARLFCCELGDSPSAVKTWTRSSGDSSPLASHCKQNIVLDMLIRFSPVIDFQAG